MTTKENGLELGLLNEQPIQPQNLTALQFCETALDLEPMAFHTPSWHAKEHDIGLFLVALLGCNIKCRMSTVQMLQETRNPTL